MARLIVLAVFLMCLVYSTMAYDFYVGVRSGWVVKPAENYNSWAGRMRFQVKDKLIFNYKEGGDSVLVVTKEDYESCNTKNPIRKFEDGKSVFVFDRSGPFFFISGTDGHCSQGQKLIVVVMAVRNKTIKPSPTPSSPTSSPSISPSISPAAPISTPSSSPSFAPDSNSPSSSPDSNSPSFSPSFAPESNSPSSSSSPSPSPSPSFSSSPSKTPALSPVQSPENSSPSSSISPAIEAPGAGNSGGGSSSGGVSPPAISPSSNSTSTPTSSAQIITVSRLSFGIFTLFLSSAFLL